MKPLVYGTTNESLYSIIFGLDLHSSDRVLAICGAGDQAFAMAPRVASINAVDINPSQVEYARKMQLLLACGEFEKFYDYRKVVSNCGFAVRKSGVPNLLAAAVRARNSFFIRDDNLSSVKANVHKVKINEPQDILSEVVLNGGNYDKIYLSNASDYTNFAGSHGPRGLRNLLMAAGNVVRPGTLVYFTDLGVCGCPNASNPIAPLGWKIDEKLSVDANKYQLSSWNSFVVRKL